jgi:leucyl-tRNA synthetase
MVTMFSPDEGKVLKMSKSKGNVVSLDDAVSRFGADATRMATLYLGPAELDAEWDEDSDKVFAGPYRFLERVWRMTQAQAFDREWQAHINDASFTPADVKLRRKTHQTIEKVQNDIEGFALNTAIAALMEHANALQEWLNATGKEGGNGAVYSEAVETMLLLLSPFAPHAADELLSRLGFAESAYVTPWPRADENVAREDEVIIPVQINGKLRARIVVPAGSDEVALRERALSDAEVSTHLGGKEPKRVIIVPGRLINIVL